MATPKGPAEDALASGAAGKSLPCLKGKFAFQLATTSYILPSALLPNIQFLGRYVDEVELVLFESGNQSNLPTPQEVREMARLAADFDLTYNVHLPGDLFFGDPDPTLRREFCATAVRFYERTLPLDPTSYILHLDSRRADGTIEEDQGQLAGPGERITGGHATPGHRPYPAGGRKSGISPGTAQFPGGSI